MGYGVTAYSSQTPIFRAAILPFDKPDNLLFNLRDRHTLNVRKGQIVPIEETRSFKMENNEGIIEIKSDLDENDTDSDNNDDDLDEGDDRLNVNGNVQFTELIVKNLPFNRAVPVTHVFKSGGTEVALHFVVEKTGQNPFVLQ